MRRIDHLTPKYVYHKICVILYEKKYPNHPWLTKQSVSLLNTMLSSQDIGVEFGSGRSTKWFLKKISHLTSVENKKDWYQKVEAACDLEIKNERLDYRFAETQKEYSSIINEFDDSSIDFALVDGAYRDLCASSMVRKIKIGGLIVIDNVNLYIPNDATRSPDSRKISDGYSSEDWKKFGESVAEWRMIWTSNGVYDTAIWIRR